jgi:hypothetical protein
MRACVLHFSARILKVVFLVQFEYLSLQFTARAMLIAIAQTLTLQYLLALISTQDSGE